MFGQTEVLMRIIAFIFALTIFTTSCDRANHNNSVWTEAYEQKLSRQVDAEIGQRLPNDDKRKKLVAFIVKRLKEELPLGVESVTADSLHAISSKIGKEYGYADAGNDTGITPKLVPWTPEIEQTLREAFLHDVREGDIKSSELMFGCVIAKLRQNNRDSIMLPIPHEMVQTVAKDCIIEVGRELKK